MSSNTPKVIPVYVTIYLDGLYEKIIKYGIGNVFLLFINLFIILITHLKKSFNLSYETKKIVFLFCYTGLIFSLWEVFHTILLYLLCVTNKKIHLIIADILEQLYFVFYNICYITPFYITYWRFMLIIYNRKTSIFENLIIFILTIVPNLVAFFNVVFFSNFGYRSSIFEYKHWYSSDLFTYMDIGPQVASSILSFILNIIILVNIRIKRNSTSNRINHKSSDFSLTINLLLHTIFPFVLLVYSNLLLIIPIFDDHIVIKPITFDIIAYLDLFYRFLSPITMILFMEVYRKGFKNWFGVEEKNVSKITISKRLFTLK